MYISIYSKTAEISISIYIKKSIIFYKSNLNTFHSFFFEKSYYKIKIPIEDYNSLVVQVITHYYQLYLKKGSVYYSLDELDYNYINYQYFDKFYNIPIDKKDLDSEQNIYLVLFYSSSTKENYINIFEKNYYMSYYYAKDFELNIIVEQVDEKNKLKIKMNSLSNYLYPSLVKYIICIDCSLNHFMDALLGKNSEEKKFIKTVEDNGLSEKIELEIEIDIDLKNGTHYFKVLPIFKESNIIKSDYIQETKKVVDQSNNYYDYIIKENNALYKKQLPLLLKNSRMSSLVLSRPKRKQNEIIFQSTKNFTLKEDKKTEINSENEQYNSPLNSIRSKKIRSRKLPPLCPIYDSRGLFIRSIVSPKRIFCRNMIYNNNNNILYNLPSSLDINRNNTKIFKGQKIKIKKLLKNKSCDYNLELNYNDFKNHYFNEPEYNHLKYDESLIYGQRKLYEEIIRKKLIELQIEYNKNLTIKKEKTYRYGLRKKHIYLTFDSLKIRLNEIKDESNIKIEVYEEPSFEYVFPFALLPLYYSKNIESFLSILTRLFIWDEENQKFYMTDKDDEVIACILKNYDDYCVTENYKSIISSNIDEKEVYENNLNMNDLLTERKNNNINKNNILLNDFNRGSSSLINSINTLRMNSLNRTINENKENKENMDILYLEYKKNFKTKCHDIYPSKTSVNYFNISTFEYFWLTPKKAFILTIETPLITVNIPSNNIVAKKYIDFDLLFFIYSKNFIMWDFYIINNLLTFKNFRNILDYLYTIPEKRDVSIYITEPKHRRHLITSFELSSIFTKMDQKRNPRKMITDRKEIMEIKEKTGRTLEVVKEKEKEEEKEKGKINQELNKVEDYNKKEESNNNINNENNNTNINNNPNNNVSYSNSIFIQKGLLAIASFIDVEKKICNEYTFHFNVDQLRKFQIMEMFFDKLSLFVKFLNIDYEKETFSFDFNSFNEFNEFNWIKDISKYNCNYRRVNIPENNNNNKSNNAFEPKLIDEFPGIIKGTKIRIEIKYPLILMKTLDENGYLTTETVNVDYKVEKILSKMIIHNSIDLTRQLIEILKDNNFCRKIYISRKDFSKKRMTRKKMKNKFSF